MPDEPVAALRAERPDGSRRNNTNERPERSAGASEGIRTLDPNLGKVVLYP